MQSSSTLVQNFVLMSQETAAIKQTTITCCHLSTISTFNIVSFDIMYTTRETRH